MSTLRQRIIEHMGADGISEAVADDMLDDLIDEAINGNHLKALSRQVVDESMRRLAESISRRRAPLW